MTTTGQVEAAATSRKGETVRVHAWYDSAALPGAESGKRFLAKAVTSGYTAVVLHTDTAAAHTPTLPDGVLRVLDVRDCADLDLATSAGIVPSGDARRAWVVAGEDTEALAQAARDGIATCLRASAHDAASLHGAISSGRAHQYLCVRFPDPTNIPLELVIASLQATKTIVIKEVTDAGDVDDAVVSLGVMEVGSDGVLFSPREEATMDRFLAAVRTAAQTRVDLAAATVTRTAPVGMGHRGCIDLATIFTPQEGMLVGSTSQGGLLCCPEVFFLPYMDPRPFRVNAGAVHSYVYGPRNRTNYLTELRAGLPAMVVGLDGRTRDAPVGRIKTEVRPLRLVEAQFPGGEMVNVLMQDDWHVRVFAADGTPRNITELKPGDQVLGHLSAPGRHVGIAVDETIEEC